MSLREGQFEGHLDRIDNGWVFGWAWQLAFPNEPVRVDVYVDGALRVTAPAALYRPDLEASGKGDGRHAFEVALQEELRDGRPHEVRVRYAGTDLDIPGSPALLSPESGRKAEPDLLAANGPAPAAGPRFRSPFGGLWTDLSIGRELIDGKAALGWISDEEARLLRDWVENGYVILRQAVPHEAIDRLEADVENIWMGKSSVRCFVEFFEGETMVIYPAGPRFKDRRNKLLDLHVHLESARRVVFAEPLLRFLSLIFERPALAFQCLYFRLGSRQDIHQDSAFVKVSSPLEFAASWVALEDVRPDSGELEYFVGSHELEDYLFDGRYKWMPTKSAEYDRFIAALRRRSEERGLRRERFLPKKGDVLLWAADLGHGGCKNVTEGLTRKSIVTHYCPVNCDPVDAHGVSKHPRTRYDSRAYYTAPPRE